jgi:hypothetical protein
VTGIRVPLEYCAGEKFGGEEAGGQRAREVFRVNGDDLDASLFSAYEGVPSRRGPAAQHHQHATQLTCEVDGCTQLGAMPCGGDDDGIYCRGREGSLVSLI